MSDSKDRLAWAARVARASIAAFAGIIGAGTSATPLHDAACKCDRQALTTAAATVGQNYNVRDAKRNTALHLLAGVTGEEAGSASCAARLVTDSSACRRAVRYLIVMGADVNAANFHGENPLHFAARNRRPDVEDTAGLIQDLIDAGADPNRATPSRGNTPLHVAVGQNAGHDEGIVSALLRNGARVDAVNAAGDTPLMRAVRNGPDRGSVAPLLLSNGADPNRRDRQGDWPLHTAIKEGGNRGKEFVVDALLAANADPCVRDAGGYTPYQIAAGSIREALSRAGGFDRSNPNGQGCPSLREKRLADARRAEAVAATREAERKANEEADRATAAEMVEERRRRQEAARAAVAASREAGERNGTQDRNYRVVSTPFLVFPRRAQTRGIEGHVVLEYTVTATGAVRDPVVVDAEPLGVFEQAAIDAAQGTRYSPRVVNGKAVHVKGVRRMFRFELDDPPEPSAELAKDKAVAAQMAEERRIRQQADEATRGTAQIESARKKDQELPRFLVAAHVFTYSLVQELPYPKAGATYSVEVVSDWPFGDGNLADYCAAKLSMYGTSAFPAGGCQIWVIGDASAWTQLNKQHGPVEVLWSDDKCIAVFARADVESRAGGLVVARRLATVIVEDSEAELRARFRVRDRARPPSHRDDILEIKCL